MWMQVFAAAGFAPLGPAFPAGWGERLREANPAGFFESHFRTGVHAGTNPHPKTGKFYSVDELRGRAVKVFVPGVLKTDTTYIDHLVANIREWREYCGSLQRMYAMEEAAREPGSEPLPHLPAALEWWSENYALIRDVQMRRYPARLYSYDHVVREPQVCVRDVLAWMGSGDVEAALGAVKPKHRTQRAGERGGELALDTKHVDADDIATFDALYEAVDSRAGFSAGLIADMRATDKRLQPKIVAGWAEVRRKKALARSSKK